MNNFKKIVIAFSKDTLTFVLVQHGKNPIILKQTQVSWTTENLEKILQTIVQKTNLHAFSLLLMDDIAYTHTFTLDKPNGKNTLRSAIYKQLCELVPEVLQDTQWDYKILSSKGKSVQVVAFVPVLSFFSEISQALHSVNLVPNSIESEALAKTRDENPYIGTINKNDIKGNDDTSINIQLLEKKIVPHVMNTQTTQPKQQKPLVRPGFIYTLILTLLCSAFSLILIQTNRPPKYIVYAPFKETVETTDSIESNVPYDLPLENIRVQILNGSGVAGQAKNIETFLQGNGFTNIQIGTGDLNNGALTFKIKESTQSAILDQKIRDIFSEITPITTETLQQDSKYDVVIVIGGLYDKK